MAQGRHARTRSIHVAAGDLRVKIGVYWRFWPRSDTDLVPLAANLGFFP